MIIKDYYMTRTDGVKLYRNYSDAGMMIRQDQTGHEYSEAVDVEDAPYTYTETETPVPEDFELSEPPVVDPYIPAQDALNIIMGEGE